MFRIEVPADFDAWREHAREALWVGRRPEEVHFADSTAAEELTLPLTQDTPATGVSVPRPFVPKEFIENARFAALHRSPQRWDLLYRLLYRLQHQRGLMRLAIDEDVSRLRQLAHQVHHDIHKMHAFVRFRRIEEPDDHGSTHEHFIAWYRPDHRVLHEVAPFFVERFAVMRWTIMTPDETANWDPGHKQLIYGPGVRRETAPQEDEVEDLWRSYYGAIFNPARVNPRAMRGHMPVRFWNNLPELATLPVLMQGAEARVATMVAKQKQQPTAAPFVPAEHTLPVLRAAMPKCEGCDLFRCAIQVVPGAGGGHAKLMLVGEQPGDQEDQQGEPFVGPAGRILRKAIEELRIEPKHIFMTNAVKHFKFVQRGKLRLHQSPRMGEINACRPWLVAEIDAVKPRVVLCLGASAAKSLLGGTFALMKERGTLKQTPYAERVLATVHPSAVLRARDDQGREGLYQFLKDDLALAYTTALKSA